MVKARKIKTKTTIKQRNQPRRMTRMMGKRTHQRRQLTPQRIRKKRKMIKRMWGRRKKMRRKIREMPRKKKIKN